MGNDYVALGADADQYPDKYEPEAIELIWALRTFEKKLPDLTPEELRILDRAVIDYAGPDPKPEPVRQAPKTPPAPKVEKPKGPEEEPTEKVAEPVDQLTANWWVTDSGSRSG